MPLKKQRQALAGIPVIVFIFSAFMNRPLQNQAGLDGPWQSKENSTETVLIFQDGYFSKTVFDKANKKFVVTSGGSYKHANGTITVKTEFDSKEAGNIGKEEAMPYTLAGDKLTVTGTDGRKKTFDHIDNGKTVLAGNWRITGRMVDDKFNEMPRRDRKTLKLLSETRFQWMAINPATKEFFGTGGGTYTFVNGKYTEHIEFFSRDSSRVGASLEFDGTVENDRWHHSGKSSKGDPISEIWTRER